VCAFNWRQIDRNVDAKQGIRDALVEARQRQAD
jgi:hypothetical protein